MILGRFHQRLLIAVFNRVGFTLNLTVKTRFEVNAMLMKLAYNNLL